MIPMRVKIGDYVWWLDLPSMTIRRSEVAGFSKVRGRRYVAVFTPWVDIPSFIEGTLRKIPEEDVFPTRKAPCDHYRTKFE